MAVGFTSWRAFISASSSGGALHFLPSPRPRTGLGLSEQGRERERERAVVEWLSSDSLSLSLKLQWLGAFQRYGRRHELHITARRADTARLLKGCEHRRSRVTSFNHV